MVAVHASGCRNLGIAAYGVCGCFLRLKARHKNQVVDVTLWVLFAIFRLVVGVKSAMPMRVDQLIAEQALRNPSAIAVEFDRSGKTLSYAELEERAARVADAIASATAAPGRTVSAGQAIVCINTDRSIGMVVGLVGIWKSGSAYVPIDPHYPCERQQYILDDSQSNVLVTLVSQSTSEAVKRAQQQGITVIYLDDHGNLLSVPKQPPRSSIQAVQTDQSDGALAYVLYTSGSTGKPKGCMIQHSNVMNMLRHFRDDLSVSNSSAVLCVTTFCFDISVLELFLPLTSGAKLILIASETQADGSHFWTSLMRILN